MPYIEPRMRSKFTRALIEIEGGETKINTPGELNFLISAIVGEYLRQHCERYATMNDVMGALAGAQLEFYRRVVAPYEDTKIEQNGDVY